MFRLRPEGPALRRQWEQPAHSGAEGEGELDFLLAHSGAEMGAVGRSHNLGSFGVMAGIFILNTVEITG